MAFAMQHAANKFFKQVGHHRSQDGEAVRNTNPPGPHREDRQDDQRYGHGQRSFMGMFRSAGARLAQECQRDLARGVKAVSSAARARARNTARWLLLNAPARISSLTRNPR
jgi:hypothetical protein